MFQYNLKKTFILFYCTLSHTIIILKNRPVAQRNLIGLRVFNVVSFDASYDDKDVLNLATECENSVHARQQERLWPDHSL